MIETLLNGRVDAWWELAILILISSPIWFPLVWLLAYIILRVAIFVLPHICWWRLY